MRNYWQRSGLQPLPVWSLENWNSLKIKDAPRLIWLLMVVVLAVGWGGGSPSARADGGAPNLAYVVGGGKSGDQLVVVDIAKRSVDWSVTLNEPQAVVLSTDARFAYVAEAGANRVAIVDTRAQQVVGSMAVGSGPRAIAVDPLASVHWLFVANTNSNTLTILDADTQRVRATLAVGKEPVGVAAASPISGMSDSSSLEVYVANRASQTLSVITPGNLRTVATIALPEPPCAITIPATGGIAYVATCPGKVLAVSLASHRVLGTLFANLGGTPGTMDYDAVTGQLYVPVPTKDQVVLLRPAGMRADGSLAAPPEPLRTLTYPGAPSAVAITFDGALGFIAQRSSGQVVEFDATTRDTLGTVSVGGAPRAIVTGPYPPALNRQTSSTLTTVIYGAFALALALFIALMVRDNIKRHRRSG